VILKTIVWLASPWWAECKLPKDLWRKEAARSPEKRVYGDPRFAKSHRSSPAGARNDCFDPWDLGGSDFAEADCVDLS
jgi:hypothetical protein